MEATVTDYVKGLLPTITRNDYLSRTVKLDKVETINPKINDIGKLQRLGETYARELIFYFSTYKEDGELEVEFQDSLRVPVLINNAFMIDGSIMVNELTLTKDDRVRFYDDSITFDNSFTVYYVREDSRKGGKLIDGRTRYYDKKGNLIEVLVSELEEKKLKLEFSDFVKLKLQVKLDLNYEPEYLTKDIFWAIVKYGPDMKKDNIIDKRLSNTQEDLKNYLRSRERRNDVLHKLTRTFYKSGMFRLATIQTKIDYYFKGGEFSKMRYIPQTNPLALDSMINKVRIHETVAYNDTFMDLIDPINTPENNNVNAVNELNTCVDLSGGEVKIECIDFKTNKPVKVKYMNYLNSKVLVSDYYDYEEGKVIESDKYEIKYHQRISEVKKLPSDLKYIEPSEDDRLSLTTRQIPMINYSEPTRIRMGTGMSKQAVEVKGHEPRLISTGNESKDYLKYSMTQFFLNTKGVVKSIVDDVITIEDEDGTDHEFTIPETIYGINGANTSYTTKLKVGDLIEPKQPIITSTIQQNKQYEFGVNAFMIYMVYFGYEYEDAFIISRSFSDKMTYYTIEDVVIDVKADDIIDYIIPIGSEVKSLDRLVGQMRKIDDKHKSTFRDKLVPSKLKDMTHIRKDVITPNNYRLGWVLDIKVLKNPDKNKFGGAITTTDEFINDYLGEVLNYGSVSKDIRANYSSEIPKEQLNSRIRDIKLVDEDDKYCIMIRLLKKNALEKGGKITNSWGSKGTISMVLPDEEMPYVGTKGQKDYRPAEVLINPNSVTARMNYSQLYECLLTSCINKLYQRVVEMFNNGDGDLAMAEIRKYYPKEYKDTTIEEMIKILDKKGVHAFNMKVKSLSKLEIQKIKDFATDMSVSEVDWVTIPGYGKIDTPQVCGYSYMMRLYHAADASAKVTSAVRTTGSPLMGFGEYRPEGQRVGEMESWALQGSDVYEIVTKTSKDYILNQLVFANQLLLAGFALTDAFGNPLLSDKYRESKMISKFLKERADKLEENSK